MQYMAMFSRCALIGFAAFAASTTLAADEPPVGQEAGFRLFTRIWQANDTLAKNGDGLGPMHNAQSCAECHDQSGVGGGGRANVTLLSVIPEPGERLSSPSIRRRLERVHPAFTNGHAEVFPTIVLHRLGALESKKDYADFRKKLDPLEDANKGWHKFSQPSFQPLRKSKNQNSLGEPIARQSGVRLVLNRRNTPALWGAGQIDAVTEEELLAVQQEQQDSQDQIHGRVPRADNGAIGRFGWRGQTDTLRSFVMEACANELGLQCAGHKQALNPLSPEYVLEGVDLSEQQCADMVAFVATLPRPMQIDPENPDERSAALHGEQLFTEIGCAVCHRPNLGEIDGLYSDLLLHDMGSDLSDVAAANAPPESNKRLSPDDALARRQREWRTPALWGVRDSSPYLHDGRTDSLQEAIKLHGGEGQASAAKFKRLPSESQKDLIAFLDTLRAPRNAPQLPPENRRGRGFF